MALGLLSGCECESVGVAQEAHDHSYFRTWSVVKKVHPKINDPASAVNYEFFNWP